MSEPQTPEQHAVHLNAYLRHTLATYGALATADESFQRLTGRAAWDHLHDEVDAFCDGVLAAMGELPDPPRRAEKVGDDFIAFLAARIIPVSRSYRVAVRLLRVCVPVLSARERVAYRLRDLLQEIFNGDERYHRWHRLDAWIFRRTEKGAKRAAEYDAQRSAPKKSKAVDVKKLDSRAAYVKALRKARNTEEFRERERTRKKALRARQRAAREAAVIAADVLQLVANDDVATALGDDRAAE